MRSPHENIARVSCDTCFMGHLESRIRWWHSFSYLTQSQVKFRSKESNLGAQKIPFRTYLSFPVLSQDSKIVVCFEVQRLEIPKNEIQKSDVITFTRVLGHCTARNKDIRLKVFTLVVDISFFTIYSDFYIWEKFDFVGIYFWKFKILIFNFWGPKTKKGTSEIGIL